MNLYYIIVAATSFQGLLLALALQKVSCNKTSLRWLSALLIGISLSAIGRIFADESLFALYPKMPIAADLILFLYGPFVFLYVKSIFYTNKGEQKNNWQHFLIAFLYLIWISQYLLASDKTILHLLAQKFHQVAGVYTEIFGWIHTSIYLIAAIKLFLQYPVKAKALVSNLPMLNFLRYFFAFNIVLVTMWAIGFLLRQADAHKTFVLLAYNSIWILLTITVYIIGYYAVFFPEVFRVDNALYNQLTNNETEIFAKSIIPQQNPLEVKQKNLPTQDMEDIKEEALIVLQNETKIIIKQNASFTQQQYKDLVAKLKPFMDDEKPYLDPLITLPMLAGKLCCTVHLLSKIINETQHKNFFDYINGYRVYYFIELVKIPANKQYTLLSLAFESGFNAKSTFNNAFKKEMGKTPSAFIQELTIIKTENG